MGGKYDTIVINRGSSDRLRSGDLLALQKPDIVVDDMVGKPVSGSVSNAPWGSIITTLRHSMARNTHRY